MFIKVIAGFYDYDKRRIIEKDEALDTADERAEEFIAKGLAVKAKKPSKKPKRVDGSPEQNK